MNVYLKAQFLEEMEKRGAGLGYKTLLRYEELGVIPRPPKGWRIYREEDLDDYAAKIKKYRTVEVGTSEPEKTEDAVSEPTVEEVNQ